MSSEDMRLLARAADSDRYIASLFLPEAIHAHVWALLAFAGDVAAVPSKVSDPAIGEIRLQWWHDTLAAIGNGEKPDHPIALALSKAIVAHQIPIAPLQALVDAHRFDLYADVAANWTEVEGYLGETQSILFQLTALMIDPIRATTTADASGFAGVALGLARAKHNVSLRSKLTPTDATEAEMNTRAEQRLNQAQMAIANQPELLRAAYLPLVTAELYLKSKTPPAQWRKQWAIWRAARRGEI